MRRPVRVRVRLGGGRGYAVIIGEGVCARSGALLRECSVDGECYLVSDERVYQLYGPQVEDAFRESGYAVVGRSLLPPGEASKTLEHWRRVLDSLVGLEDGMRRRLFVAVCGGGVVGDLGGFVAATYKRGTPYVQIPTTLLAQVDSSVGGKTAVNHPGGKNLVGAFHHPAAVLIDTACLRTLPIREVRSGLVEVIKYGLIRDHALFTYVERNLGNILERERDTLTWIVKRSCEIKAQVIREDEKEEKGIRTILNLGHTVGHALETASEYGRLTHGEAVALGILCASRISVVLKRFSEDEYGRIRSLLMDAGLPVEIEGVSPDAVWEAMKRDKKFIHGRNRFVLPVRIGKVTIAEDVPSATIVEAIKSVIA